MPAPSSSLTSSGLGGALHARVVGGAGSTIWAGQLDDWHDENPKTRRSRWYGEPGVLGEGQKMLADPHVRRSRDAVVDPVVGATWDFEPASKESLDLEVAEYCRFVFFECLSWHSFLAQAIRAYIRDGFAVFEQTDNTTPIPPKRFPSHPGGGVGVGVTGLHFRPAWTLWGWGQSKRDPAKLDYIEQFIPGSDVEEAGLRRVSAKRLLRFSWEQEAAHFEGHPILRSAWGPWMAKRMLMRIEVQSHERNHMAQPFLTPPEGTDTSDAELDKAMRALSHFRANQNGAFILPGGYTVDFKSGQANTNIQATIERLNLDIALNVASQSQLLGSRGSSGSHALAQTQDGQFKITLDKHARFICDVFNNGTDGWSIVERIVRLNYGQEVTVPRLVSRNMPTVNWKEVIPVLIDAKRAGVIKADLDLDKFVRQVMSAPKRDEATQHIYDLVQPLPNTAANTEGGQLALFGKENNVEE